MVSPVRTLLDNIKKSREDKLIASTYGKDTAVALRKFKDRIDDLGKEIVDTTPHVDFIDTNPHGKVEAYQSVIKALSDLAASQHMETLEEANDFGPEDDESDALTIHEFAAMCDAVDKSRNSEPPQSSKNSDNASLEVNNAEKANSEVSQE